jgi:4-amino-4-deoxy-L-arabinose transferase-like glycosyltransferase
MAAHIKRTIILLSLVAVIGFALLYKLGAFPLVDPDEPRYAESAREMMERGSYMVPYFNYELRLQKPVLHYLLICASYKFLDVSEFSARLPSVLAALVVLFLTFLFTQRFCGITAATLSCLIMGSSPLYFVPGRLTMPDMVFSCFMIASLFSFYLGWNSSASGVKKRWYAGFYFFQVIAAWTKGPVGILVPVAVALLSLWQQRDLRELKSLRLGRGLALVLLASLPWYVYIYFFVDKGTMTVLSQRETVGRIFGWFGRNYDPLHYYFLVVLAGMLPWTFLLPWALYRRFRTLEPSRFRHFLEVWFLFVFFFFTVCATKKAQYIVMLSCVGAAWLSTVVMDTLHETSGRRDTGLIVSLFAFLAISIVGAFKGLSWLSKNQPDLIVGGMAGIFTLIVPALASVWLASRGHARSALVALSFVTLLSLIPAVAYGTAWVEKNRSMKAFLQENEAVITQARELYTGVKIFNGLPFYLRRQVVMDTDEDTLMQKLQGTEPCVVFTSDKRYAQHSSLFSPYLTAAKYGKVLLSNFAAKGATP